MRRFELNLRLFDGGDGAAAGATAAGDMGVTGGDAASTSVTAGDAAGNRAEGADAASNRPSFEDLVKGDYKAEADKYINQIVRERVKGPNATIKAQNEILSVVAAKYGMDAGKLDLNALKEKVTADDMYYEDKAAEAGLTVEQYRRVAEAESKGRAYDLMMQDMQAEQEAKAELQRLQTEAEQVRQMFPDFDLNKEMQNPVFQKLIANGVNMNSAYTSVHADEILTGAMQRTAQAVREATANEIAARGTRPRENASSSRAAATMKTDVTKLSDAELRELSRRARAGEMVYLS